MCTACISACDEVMEKVGKPKQLIAHTSEAKLAGEPYMPLWKRPRLWIYGVLVSGFIAGLLVLLFHRQPVRLLAVRGTEGYLLVSNDQVVNHFKLHVYNRSLEAGEIFLALPAGSPGTLIIPELHHILPAGKNLEIAAFSQISKRVFKEGKYRQRLEYKMQFPKHRQVKGVLVLDLVGPDSD